jgi:choice-of-anchor A domain-containing protein
VKSNTLTCISAIKLLARKITNSRELRWLILAVVASISFAPHLMADLGSAKSFVVLSSGGSVTFQNRDAVSKPTIAGATTCPGAAGCTMRVGGNTILMGRGNSTGPDQIGGDLIARATASQGLNCAGSAPGKTAICSGNISSVSGACITGGGDVSNPTACAGGVDTSGTNTAVASLLPKAGPDAAAFSASLAALPVTQTLSAINVPFGASATITANAGLNVISVPFIVIGSGATLTISGLSGAQVVINVGSLSTPGVLTLNLSAKVLLAGGITPDRVVFNVLGAGGNLVQLGNTIIFNGTILGPQQSLMLTDGSTPQPTIINGALLFGLTVSIGNNVNINFYPLAQIVQPVVFTPVTTVDVMQLPTPTPSTGPIVGADAESEEPIIEELPPTTGQLSPLSVADSPSTIAASAVVVMRANQTSQDPLETGVVIDGLGNVNSKAPPDTQIAVGQNVIVEMVNVSGAVYDKVSGRQLKTFDLGKMFGTNAGQGTDPRVMYDAASRHFFAAYELKTAGGDDIRLAVAEDPTVLNGNLQFPWTVFDIRSNNVDTCFDQPKLGFSDDKVMLSWNDYRNANSCSNLPASSFSGSEYVIADKASLFTNNGFGLIGGPDTNRFQIVPVQSLTPTAVQYAAYHPLTGVFADSTTNFRVMAFAGRVGTDLSLSEQAYQIRPTPRPPDAHQPPGGNPQIDAAGSGTRLLSAVWHNDYLWGTMNEGCTPLLDTTMRSCGRVVKVSTSRSTLVEDRDLQVLPQNGVGVDLYYPAVILNSRGDVFFGFTVSSTALNPTAAVFGVLNSDFNSLQSIIAYAVGTQVYNVTNSSGFLDRWGDYSGAAIDPVDPNVVWLAQEYSKGDWGTAIARVFFGSPTTITYHQTGACNGFVDSSGGHSAGPNQAYVIFGIERIDNSGGPSFAFDPANLYVQQASRHFFDSSLSIYSGVLGPFAAVPTNLTAGQNLGFNPTAQGALVVSTTATDGASEANNTAYFLSYNRKLNDPPVNLVKSDASRTSWPYTPDCKTITLQ